MWLMLSDCFFSIVSKDCARDEVLVRARRKGDIEKLFPAAKVRRDDRADYLYRAAVKKNEVADALMVEVHRVTYPNFKDSVKDPALHRAYSRVWADMLSVEEPGRLGSWGSLFGRFDEDEDFFLGGAGPAPPEEIRIRDMPQRAGKRRRKRRPLRRGQ